MGFVKRTIFSWMGIIIMVMFLSYGLDIILSINGYGGVATYLEHSTHTTSYGYTFEKWTWNYIDYANNLPWNSDIIYNWALHADIGHLARGFEKAFSYAIPPQNAWEAITNALKYMANIWINLLNIIIYMTNIILLIHNFINMLLIWVFSLIGVKMTYGSWWLANVFQWQVHNLWIPYVPTI